MASVLEQSGIELLAGSAFIGLLLAILIPIAIKKSPAAAIRVMLGIVAMLAVTATVTTVIAIR